MPETKTTRYLRYDFSEKEKQELGSDMAQAVQRVESGEAKLKSVQSQIKSEIAVATEHVKGTAEKIRSGYEMRSVECSLIMNFGKKVVTTVRDDTGKVVDKRDMTDDERQQELPAVK